MILLVSAPAISEESVVQDRYRKMVRFKRIMVTVGLIDTEGCNLTDRDAVDELVYFLVASKQARASCWDQHCAEAGTVSASLAWLA